MSELSGREAIHQVNECFRLYGVPKKIKIDNGWPLVCPHQLDLPTLSVLWWIGLGIEVQQNQPACPQQNGTVEGLQGTCARWSNPALCQDIVTFQLAVLEACPIQREVYRMPRHQYKTRLELYPELLTNSRGYSPKNFSWQRVKAYLAEQVWDRVIKKGGCIKFFSTDIYIGTKFAHQKTTVTFDPIEEVWMVRALDGKLLKSSSQKLVTESQILKHVGMSKN